MSDARNSAILKGVLLRISSIKHFITRYDMNREVCNTVPILLLALAI